MTVSTADTAHDDRDAMWVFGYGSLIWKVDFPYEQRQVCLFLRLTVTANGASVPGFIHGHVRRFWQASTDHRGTEAYPGRVATLIPHEEWRDMEDTHAQEMHEVTWGMVYKVPDADVERVRAHLDYREKNGYTIHYVDVYQEERTLPVVRQAMVYIGTTANSEFIGPELLAVTAERIARSVGPSGHNRDYLLQLCGALRTLSPHAQEHYLSDLEHTVLQIEEDPSGN